MYGAQQDKSPTATELLNWLNDVHYQAHDHGARRSFSNYPDAENVRASDSEISLLLVSPDGSFIGVTNPCDGEDDEGENAPRTGTSEQAFGCFASALAHVSGCVMCCLGSED